LVGIYLNEWAKYEKAYKSVRSEIKVDGKSMETKERQVNVSEHVCLTS
jgi:hypothetical protein